MDKVKAFFKLLRFNNLIFIVLTQFLFQFAVVHGFFYLDNLTGVLPNNYFYFLVVASVCIAAGGYIINDYFDVNIDLINKPHKTYIKTIFSRRAAIKFHFIITTIGMVCTCFVAYKLNNWWLAVGNLLAVFLLVIYSVSLKRKILVGNFLVALLIVYTLGILLFLQLQFIPNSHPLLPKFLRISGGYILFSFITTLIREAIKDLEDIEGDRKNGCQTLAIVYHVDVAKMYTGVLICITNALIIAICFYACWLQYYLPAIYLLVLLFAPMVYCLKLLYTANSKLHFALISKWLKIVMLFGILSMLFFFNKNIF